MEYFAAVVSDKGSKRGSAGEGGDYGEREINSARPKALKHTDDEVVYFDVHMEGLRASTRGQEKRIECKARTSSVGDTAGISVELNSECHPRALCDLSRRTDRKMSRLLSPSPLSSCRLVRSCNVDSFAQRAIP